MIHGPTSCHTCGQPFDLFEDALKDARKAVELANKNASLLSQLQAAEETEIAYRKALVEAQEYGHEVDCSLDLKEGLACDCRLSVLEAALALRDGGK